jgi:putative ATPase
MSSLCIEPFTKIDLETLLERAMKKRRIDVKKKIELKETEALLRLSGGDGRNY